MVLKKTLRKKSRRVKRFTKERPIFSEERLVERRAQITRIRKRNKLYRNDLLLAKG